jgi:aminoglycoside 3-N-acetyltransferase
MSLITSKAKVAAQLAEAFDSIGSGPVLLHLDMLHIGVLDSLCSRQEMCRRYQEAIDGVFQGREYLIPTFNYDYCKDGIYDVEKSPSQIGALTDYYRINYWQKRTRTPVFNFCVRNQRNITLAPVKNCFGTDSTFAQLVKNDGIIAFIGADFSCNTFIHHIEELMAVSYRFHKTFEGTIIDGDTQVPFQLIYRVRPLEQPNTVVYDWQRIQADLQAAGLLMTFPLGNGKLLCYRAAAAGSFWLMKLLMQPRYFLVS